MDHARGARGSAVVMGGRPTDGARREGPGDREGGTLRHIEGSAVLSPVDEGLGGTNGASQNGLETITMLGFVGADLPKDFPKLPDRR
jgi:hypothetical protein